MERRNLFYKITCSALMVLATSCGAVGELYKVNPAPGQSTWTITKNIGTISDEMTAIPLFNSDVSGGVLQISASGNYQLAEDLTDCFINITADRVSLDLKQHKVYFSNAIGPVVMINGRTQIRIFNGVLQGASVGNTGSGVQVDFSSSKVTLADLTIYNCGKGVYLHGTSDLNKVVECTLSGLTLIGNDVGLYMSYADSNIVKSCSALYSNNCGFELLNSQVNCFYDCTALKSIGTATVAGFKSTSGTSNMFQRCTTKQTKTSSPTFGDKACGFLLTGTETKTKIVDCVVNETDVVSTQTAITYGVNLAPMFAWGGYVSGFPASNSWTIGSPKWSPDSKYIVTTHKDTGNGYGSNIYTWNGLTFVVVGGSAIGTSGSLVASDVAWSPDGKYYVTATADGATFLGNTGLYAYSFDGKTDTALGSTLPTLNTINLIAVRFSPNGKFIATAGFVNASNNYLSIWSFTPSATPALVDLGDKNLGVVGPWQALSWSPDGQYIATVNDSLIDVYSVSASGALSSVAVATYAFSNVATVAWSPCGKYIAAGNSAGTVQLVAFDGTSSLKFVAQAAGLSASYILGLAWSPDGQYIAVPGGDTGAGNIVSILQYNGTSTLTIVATSSTTTTRMANIAWSPDGKNIVTMDTNTLTPNGAVNVHMFNAMYGPTNCLIDSCRVCDTLATDFNMGRGLVAGGSNVFTRNISANNGINYSYGIPNVYDGRFEILRAVVQPFDNISMPTTL